MEYQHLVEIIHPDKVLKEKGELLTLTAEEASERYGEPPQPLLATGMAKDVDAALHQIIETAGDKTADDAKAYVCRLKTEKRYQRDVY